MKKTVSNAVLSAWYTGAIWFLPLLVVLWPLSLVLQLFAFIRRKSLQRRRVSLPVPVVIVGNISVGGTGKTPLLCSLAESLQARGLRVGIISRGYGGSYSGSPRLVLKDDAATVVGDEPLLLARRTGCPVVIAHDRLRAVPYLCEQKGVDLVLSDDGLQHYALPRSVEIAVVDGSRGLGNGLCLPAGPLREPSRRLQQVNFVVVNGEPKTVYRQDQFSMALQPQCWQQVNSGSDMPLDGISKNTRVHAVAGIGNPQRFFTTLREMGLRVIEHAFPDHHAFIRSDIVFDDDMPVVMTEKDAMKCSRFAADNCYALRVNAVVDTSLLTAIMQCCHLNHFTG